MENHFNYNGNDNAGNSKPFNYVRPKFNHFYFIIILVDMFKCWPTPSKHENWCANREEKKGNGFFFNLISFKWHIDPNRNKWSLYCLSTTNLCTFITFHSSHLIIINIVYGLILYMIDDWFIYFHLFDVSLVHFIASFYVRWQFKGEKRWFGLSCIYLLLRSGSCPCHLEWIYTNL